MGVPLTVLSRINTKLVDTCRGLSQNINSVAGSIHVVEEVDWQCREGKHQQPQHSEHIRHHYKLHKERAGHRLGCIIILNGCTQSQSVFMRRDSLNSHACFSG